MSLIKNSMIPRDKIYARDIEIYVMDDNKEYLIKSRKGDDGPTGSHINDGIPLLVSCNGILYDITPYVNVDYDMYRSHNPDVTNYFDLFETLSDKELGSTYSGGYYPDLTKLVSTDPNLKFDVKCFHPREDFVKHGILKERK